MALWDVYEISIGSSRREGETMCNKDIHIKV